MASANYQTVLEKDFSSGMNQLASEDAVPVTFVEDSIVVISPFVVLYLLRRLREEFPGLI